MCARVRLPQHGDVERHEDVDRRLGQEHGWAPGDHLAAWLIDAI